MTVRRSVPAAALLVAALLALWPAAAGAHSIIRENGTQVSIYSDDATSLNTLTVALSGPRIGIRDPGAEAGFDFGSCDPGETNDRGFVIEAFCRLAGTALVRIDVGDREDTVRADLPVRVQLSGGDGADVLTTGPADDTLLGETGDDDLRAGGGADTVLAGPGTDRVDAGPGDDSVSVRDGLADTVACGEGADEVDADTADQVAGDCERVTRTETPAPGPPAGAPDRTPPRVTVGGATRQRLRRSRTLKLTASSTEAGTIAASGYLDVAGVRLPLRSRRIQVETAGAGVTVPVRLSRSEYRRARRALRRGRRVTARIAVVATDAAGNSASRRAPRIRLRG